MMSEAKQFRLQRLAALGLPPHAADLPTVHVTRDLVIHQEHPEFQHHFFQARPGSFEELKEIAGVPNRIHEANGDTEYRRFDVREMDLPQTESFDYASLPAYQQEAVRRMAHNLLYGYHDPARISRPPLAGVASWMLSRAQALPAFVAEDLIVQDGQTVTFKDSAVLHFNNVIVYGRGSIVLGANVKLYANTVEHRE